MDLQKSIGFFDPTKLNKEIHIIGCGAVGSYIAVQLAKSGASGITLWDFDTVEEKNIVNQAFDTRYINKPKVAALKHMLKQINPEINIKARNTKYTNQPVSGYIFLAVDSIDVRREIVMELKDNKNIDSFYDFRIGLDVVQHFAAKRDDEKQMEMFLNSMQFTHDEVVEEHQDGVCRLEESIVPAVLLVTADGVLNFMCYLRGSKLRNFAHRDVMDFKLGSY